MDFFEIIASIVQAFMKNAKTARAERGRSSASTLLPDAGARVPTLTPATLSISKRTFREPEVTLAVPTSSDAQDDVVRERLLVQELFATPRSLAAAFIVSEILQPPVALRQPH